jgi:hypothetical protein
MATGTFGFRAGPAAAIKVEGLSKVQRDLRKLSTDGLDLGKMEFLETNKRVAEIIIGESKKYVPVLSGALAANISETSQLRKRRKSEPEASPSRMPELFTSDGRRER